ncbi:MAG TPA: DUF2339 domain-containing protein [Terriglobales bacterium]|nr:DUF2339 domain-containing protein [Terriglobales bacterium]
MPFAALGEQSTNPQKSFDIEETLGANWLNKLGVTILVFGVAFFLAYQLKNLGPAGKDVVGFLVAAVMLGGGVWLERNERYRIPARALIGGGWALIYFVAYAMYYVPAAHVLDSQTADLVLTLAIAACMVWHTLRYDSQVVTGVAFLLGFATLTIHRSVGLSLAAGAILSLGLVVLVLRRRWYQLEVFGILAAFLDHYLWLRPVIEKLPYPRPPFPEFMISAGLLAFYWAIFRASYLLRRDIDEEQETISTVAAILNGALFLGLMKYQSAHPEWAYRFLLLLGAVEFLLAQLPAARRRRTPFVVLAIIGSTLMVAAIPFRYSGSSLAVLWLVEAEALFLAGLWLRELVFRRLGMLVATVTTAYLFVWEAPRAYHANNWHVSVTLAVAAAVFYLNALWFGRRNRPLFAEGIDHAALRAISHFGAAAVLVAIGLAASDAWVGPGWLAAALLMAVAARALDETDLTLQSVAFATIAAARTLAVNTQLETSWHGVSERLLTLALAAALLYALAAALRPRKLGPVSIAPGFTWAASFFVALLVWYELRPVAVAPAWAAFGLVLVETSIPLRSRHLRWQGYAALVAAFVRILFVNLNADGAPGEISPRFYTTVPVALVLYYAYTRVATLAEQHPREARLFSNLYAWLGTTTLVALSYFELDRDWVAAAWAGVAFALVIVAWATSRRTFLHQGVLLGCAVAVRGLTYNLLQLPYFSVTPWHSRSLTTGVAVAGLLAAMAAAMRLGDREATDVGPLAYLCDVRPEQPLFFSAVALLTLMLGFTTRSGMITVSWGLEGVAVFLFALWAGERSFRLCGLGLLLLCVGKIAVVDFWDLTLRDKWITLIILGGALMLVSFLYSRHRETIRQYL